MLHRSLGRTGVQVSALSLGSMLFGTATPAAEAARLIDSRSIGASKVHARMDDDDPTRPATRGATSSSSATPL